MVKKRINLFRGSEHYKKGSIQPIEFILANQLGFCEGNIVKYVTRYKHKGTPLEDLEKVRHYIDLLIEDLQERMEADATNRADNLEEDSTFDKLGERNGGRDSFETVFGHRMAGDNRGDKEESKGK